MRNGAEVSVSTAGIGNAGELRIQASESVEVVGTSANGNFKSQITAEVKPDGIGNGGSLSIETGQMIIRDGAEVSVSSLGSGIAGNLDIKNRSLNLDNQGSISATTIAGNGGNITLNLEDLLLLRNGSNISTTAGTAESGGDGGDINIAADLIATIPQENSDIMANAFTGNGGNINIDTQNIFGFTENPNFSNITASSQFGLDGTVNINTSGIEPGQEAIELPVEIIDVSKLINQNLCLADGDGEGEFIITGKGGLSPAPQDTLNTDAGWEDWRLVENNKSNPQQSSPIQSNLNLSDRHWEQIIEAQSWFIAPNGNIVLSAQPVKSISKSSSFNQFSCQLITIAILGFILSLSLNGWFAVNAKQPINHQSSELLIQAGKQHYDAGRFTEAARALQQAAQIYKANQDIIQQAQTLSLLSLAYQELGKLEMAEKAIASSLSLLKTLPANDFSDRSRAQIFNRQGRLLLRLGKSEQALETFQKAELLYQQAEDKIGVIGTEINQAQALQNLGFYRRAQKILTQIENQLETEPDSLLKVKSWHNLGNISRQAGDLDRSQVILEQSLAMVEKITARQPTLLTQASQNKSEILFSLANTERAIAQREATRNNLPLAESYQQAAITHYQQAAANTSFPLIKIQAKLNQLSLLLEQKQDNSAQTLLPQINSLLPQLPVSRPSLYARINFAQSLMKLESNQDNQHQIAHLNIAQILNQAGDRAKEIDDKKAESYALGTLGKFYEHQADWLKAKKFTLKALLIAQTIF